MHMHMCMHMCMIHVVCYHYHPPATGFSLFLCVKLFIRAIPDRCPCRGAGG